MFTFLELLNFSEFGNKFQQLTQGEDERQKH